MAPAAALVVLLAAGCAEARAEAPGVPPDPGGVRAAAESADDALRAAYAGADPAPLAGALAGPALAAARRRVAELARRGIRREETVLARREVHESRSAAGAEVVLEILSEQRSLVAGRPPPVAARSLRQWRAELEWRGGRWWVVEAGDLPPPQWWPEPAR